MRLHELIAVQKEAILRSWMDRVRGTLAPSALPQPELLDHLGEYLDELVEGLRQADTNPVASTLPNESPVAQQHGHQRLAQGFDAPVLVREYGVLQDCVLEFAERAGLVLTISQVRLMVSRLSAGAAEAVHHYSNARDAEARKQAAKHSAFLAHELRNPLQSATLAFTVLRNQAAAPHEKAAAVVTRSLARLRDLIDHSLIEVRLQAGLGVAAEWISVARFLEEVRDESNVEAEEKQIVVSVEADPHTRIEADPRLLRSAMSNLLRNAIKFSHRNGSVTLRATASSGRISFEVEDTCGGLPPGQVEKIFDPFVQLGTDRSGFGLGLAIAKQVSESHGGSLRVNNLPGKGCVFMLDIPERAQPTP